MFKIKAIGQLGRVLHRPAGTTRNNYNNYHQRYLIPSSHYPDLHATQNLKKDIAQMQAQGTVIDISIRFSTALVNNNNLSYQKKYKQGETTANKT